ncbi:MAG: class I SAM-dependent RNA methyltransferase [Spirochaetaceae bacterium]|nr:class I SAM-dependent RNA methyltransferase [Spirochaetaceae bacterium]
MTVVAVTALGSEKTLSNELKKLAEGGARIAVLESRAGRVRFETGLDGIYLALMALRTADRLFLRCAAGRAEDFDALFSLAAGFPPEDFIPRDMPVAVSRVRSSRSKLSAETSIQAIVHKAIAQRLCEKHGVNRLPGGKGARFRVYIENDDAEILLDLTGEPLYKRGYRQEGGIAPLRETIAASALLSAMWKRKHPLYDPFCGSGTIAIEAALYAWNIAPCLSRDFAIGKLLIANTKLQAEIRQLLLSRVDTSKPARISGSDSSRELVKLAERNMNRALSSYDRRIKINFAALDFSEARAFDADGFVITNPPYGVRLGSAEEAEENYRAMSVLRSNFPGWKIVTLTDHAGLESFFGEKASRCRELQAGALTVYQFEFPPQARGQKPQVQQKPPAQQKPREPPAQQKPRNPPPRTPPKWTW